MHTYFDVVRVHGIQVTAYFIQCTIEVCTIEVPNINKFQSWAVSCREIRRICCSEMWHISHSSGALISSVISPLTQLGNETNAVYMLSYQLCIRVSLNLTRK